MLIDPCLGNRCENYEHSNKKSFAVLTGTLADVNRSSGCSNETPTGCGSCILITGPAGMERSEASSHLLIYLSLSLSLSGLTSTHLSSVYLFI